MADITNLYIDLIVGNTSPFLSDAYVDQMLDHAAFRRPFLDSVYCIAVASCLFPSQISIAIGTFISNSGGSHTQV